MEMDKELFDTLLQAMVDMKDMLDKQSKEIKQEFAGVHEKLDEMKEDIEDIKSDLQIHEGKIQKHDRQIKKLERAIIQ